jgi:hypothetical protein
MSAVAAAVIGSSVIGAVTAKSAANAQAKAAKAGLKQADTLAGQSRASAIQLYNQGLQARQAGDRGAFNFYQQNAAKRMNPYVAGNVAAQQAIGLGAQQANNALLGLPTDMNYLNPQQLQYDGFSRGQLPQASQGFAQPTDQTQQPQMIAQPQQPPTNRLGGGISGNSVTAANILGRRF